MADVTKTIDIVVNTKKSVKEVDKLNKSLDENQEEVKETTEDTKKYEKQLDSTSEATGGMVGKLDKMTGGLISTTKGLFSSVKALKSFKIALAATGIGAVIILITALVQSFRRTEEGQDRLNKIMRISGAILDNFMDILGDVGTAIIDGLLNPMESVKKVWEGLKGFFSDPLGSIKRGYQDVKKAITEVVEEVERDISSASKLANLEAETNRLERQFWIDREKANLSISELRRKARQEDQFTAKERAEAQEQALVQLDELAEKEAVIAQNRLAIVQQSNALANSNREALDEEARLQAELISIQVRREDTARGMERILNQLRRQAVAEAEASKKANRESTEAINERLSATHELLELEDLMNDELEEQIDLEFELAEITEKANKAGIETTTELTDDQDKLNAALGATGQAAQGVLDIFSGKTTGKDIFKFFLTTLGSILSLTGGGAAGGIFGLIGGLFEDGGLLKGPSHKQGGIWVNAEGGEGIINKRSMAIPWVKDLASELNELGGGVKFADGGIVQSQTAQEAAISQLSQTLQQQQIVLPIEDLNTVQTRVIAIEDRATL